MSNCSGIFQTLDQAYSYGIPIAKTELFIRENWEGAPTIKNFTGCGKGGWNGGLAPCTSCKGVDKYGKRICNDCSFTPQITENAGGLPAAWIPNTSPES
jgi:hypothetical protein